MNLIDFEDKKDLLFPVAVRGVNLHCHSFGHVSIEKEDLLTTEKYAFKGIEDDNQILVGGLDIKISGLLADIAIFLDKSKKAEDLQELVQHIVKLFRAAGFRKMQLNVYAAIDGIADILKEEGFLPEIKYRSHLYIGGKMFSLTEYGVIL